MNKKEHQFWNILTNPIPEPRCSNCRHREYFNDTCYRLRETGEEECAIFLINVVQTYPFWEWDGTFDE